MTSVYNSPLYFPYANLGTGSAWLPAAGLRTSTKASSPSSQESTGGNSFIIRACSSSGSSSITAVIRWILAAWTHKNCASGFSGAGSVLGASGILLPSITARDFNLLLATHASGGTAANTRISDNMHSSLVFWSVIGSWLKKATLPSSSEKSVTAMRAVRPAPNFGLALKLLDLRSWSLFF